MFEKLKIHPKEKEENQYLIAKGEALYVQSTGALRDAIGEWLGYFTSLLEGQDEGKIRKQRKKWKMPLHSWNRYCNIKEYQWE